MPPPSFKSESNVNTFFVLPQFPKFGMILVFGSIVALLGQLSYPALENCDRYISKLDTCQTIGYL